MRCNFFCTVERRIMSSEIFLRRTWDGVSGDRTIWIKLIVFLPEIHKPILWKLWTQMSNTGTSIISHSLSSYMSWSTRPGTSLTFMELMQYPYWIIPREPTSGTTGREELDHSLDCGIESFIIIQILIFLDKYPRIRKCRYNHLYRFSKIVNINKI